MRKFRTVSTLLLTCMLLFSGCQQGGLPKGEETVGESAERHFAEIDTTHRYSCILLDPPEGGAFRQKLKASGGILVEMDGFAYLLGDAVYLQCFTGKAEFVEIYDRTGVHLRSVPVPDFAGLTWAPEYCLTGDDCFLVAASDLCLEGTEETEAENLLYRKYDLQGNLLAETVLPWQQSTARWTVSDSVYACAREDWNGRTTLYLFDTDMNLLQECPLDIAINTMQFAPDGTLYVQDWKNRVRTVDTATGKTHPLLPDTGDSAAVQVFDREGSVYTVEETGIIGMSEGAEQLYLNWNGSDLLSAETEVLGAWDGEHFFASFSGNVDGIPAYAVLRKVPADEPVLREIVTIRPLGNELPAWMERAVHAFNRSSTEYYIRLWESGSSYQTGMDVSFFTDQLLSEITAGNAPDLQLMDTASEELYLLMEKQGYLLDLTDLTASLTGSARGAVMTGGRCFRIPYAIRYDTLFSADGNMLTAEGLIRMAQTLGDGEYLFPASDRVMQNLTACIQSAFVDRAAGKCSFDDPMFSAYLDILKNISVCTDPKSGEFRYTDFHASGTPQYTVTEPGLPDAVAAGKIAFLPVPFCTPEIYGMAKLLYPEGKGGICGYPDTPAVIRQMDSVVIPKDGNCPAGAKAFLTYLLSAEVQTSAMVLDYYMPVTSEALEYALTYDQYYYFYNTAGPNGVQISVAEKCTEPDSYYEEYHWRGAAYTEADKNSIRSMAESESVGRLLDPMLEEIIAEEISAYLSGDRTAEDTVRVLQSRVSTYLAE